MNAIKILLASAALTVFGASAHAATFTADMVLDANRGDGCDVVKSGSLASCSANDRLNTANAADGSLDTFYSLGLGGWIELGFSNLRTATTNTISAFEVTFQPQGNHREAADVYVILGEMVTKIGRIFNDTASSGSINPGSVATNLTFDSIRLVDVTREVYPDSTSFDGYDVAQISVAAVPLPAAGLMLMGGLGGLAALRRRKKAA